ncbi:MAG: ABC transporter permease [Burkholderiaceae bacterium]
MIASIAALLIFWQMLSLVSDPLLLPPPSAVLSFVLADLRSGEMLYHLGMTLWRVAAAFVIAMLIGSAIGLFLGTSRSADRFFDPWVVLLLNIPALVLIILAYVWIGLNEVAAIGAVAMNKVPNVVVTIREGAKALDPAYREVARVFQFSRVETALNVILPQMQPYLAVATRSGIALIWKIVLVVELLGRSNGVGFQIHLYFQMFNVAAILGYTLAFVTIMLAVEVFILQPFERSSTRWRASHD